MIHAYSLSLFKTPDVPETVIPVSVEYVLPLTTEDCRLKLSILSKLVQKRIPTKHKSDPR